MIAALAECLGGLAFLIAPGAVIAVLLGTAPNEAGVMIGQVAGIALFALGIAIWGARADSSGPARRGALVAITLYNAGAGLLLIVFAWVGRAGGAVVWIAGLAHLALAVALLVTQRRRTDSSVTILER